MTAGAERLTALLAGSRFSLSLQCHTIQLFKTMQILLSIVGNQKKGRFYLFDGYLLCYT